MPQKDKKGVMDYTALNKKEWAHSNTKREEGGDSFFREERLRINIKDSATTTVKLDSVKWFSKDLTP